MDDPSLDALLANLFMKAPSTVGLLRPKGSTAVTQRDRKPKTRFFPRKFVAGVLRGKTIRSEVEQTLPRPPPKPATPPPDTQSTLIVNLSQGKFYFKTYFPGYRNVPALYPLQGSSLARGQLPSQPSLALTPLSSPFLRRQAKSRSTTSPAAASSSTSSTRARSPS